ncbi:MAG: amidohydrolase family protein [Alphaproteobacteria bacterium]
MHELVIRNARIADGLGNPLIEGDLAVANGRVAEIGRVSGAARETVDAGGMVLAPGVIDVHTHYDAQLTWDPTCSPSPALGVTTVVIGNCGFGIAPATPETRDQILANLSVVEAMSLDSLKAGVRWGFESFGEYLALLRRQGAYPNVAAYASHSTIRTVVMGAEASKRAATRPEIDRMAAILRDAMRSGAMGLGSSTFENHNGAGGVPVPSRLAEDGEFKALAAVIGEFGVGSMMATCGERTTIPFFEELATISGRPAVFAALLYNSAQPQRAPGISAAAAAARARGTPVYTQASCQPLSMDFTLLGAYPMLMLEGWPQTNDPAALARTYADPGFRRKAREDLARPRPTRLFNGHWDRVEVTIAAKPANRALEGRTIAEIAAARGADPFDAFLDIGLADALETTFTAKLLNAEEDKVEEILAVDGNLVSLSDAGAHHTFFCDAGFGMYFLGHWVREKKRFTLPRAIKKLSSDLADIYGLPDRGRLAPGAWADMILFDPDEIRVGKTERVADLPAGGARLVRRAPGLLGTWVNGVRVFDGADYARVAPPGAIITEFSRARPTVGMPKTR